jgi:hypothetical protein
MLCYILCLLEHWALDKAKKPSSFFCDHCYDSRFRIVIVVLFSVYVT